MNKHAERFCNGESVVKYDPKYEKLYEGVARLISHLELNRFTGEASLVAVLNQGGIRDVRINLAGSIVEAK